MERNNKSSSCSHDSSVFQSLGREKRQCNLRWQERSLYRWISFQSPGRDDHLCNTLILLAGSDSDLFQSPGRDPGLCNNIPRLWSTTAVSMFQSPGRGNWFAHLTGGDTAQYRRLLSIASTRGILLQLEQQVRLLVEQAAFNRQRATKVLQSCVVRASGPVVGLIFHSFNRFGATGIPWNAFGVDVRDLVSILSIAAARWGSLELEKSHSRPGS